MSICKNAIIGIIGLFCVLISAYSNASTDKDFINDNNLEYSGSKLPVIFIKNEGQFEDSILFKTNSDGITIWFMTKSVYYQLDHMRSGKFTENDLKFNKEINSLSTILKVDFVDANPLPEVIGYDKRGYSYNFFLGNDESKWQKNVSVYSYIIYHNLYPGIDLKYYQKDGVFEYEFIISPKADPNIINLQYNNVNNIQINSKGELQVETSIGTFREHKPLAYQEDIENRIGVVFKKSDDNSIGFLLGSYDNSKTLIIDPFFEFNSYLGGSSSDVCNSIVINDASVDDITLIGTTSSYNFPTVNFLEDSLSGTQDVFVTRIIRDSIVFSTYIGGSNNDLGVDIVFNGTYYLTGTTYSSDFPTTSYAYDTIGGNHGDAFVISLSADGQMLNYSTYLGGSYSYDKAYGIDVDNSFAYVVGETYSPTGPYDFPTVNAYDSSYNGGHDVFLTKLASNGQSLLFSTYIGGTLHDYGYDLALCTDYVYIAGKTNSSNFPHTEGVIHGGYDGFFSKLTKSGNLVLSHFYGGTDDDAAYCITINYGSINPCDPIFGGQTFSSDIFVNMEGQDSTYGGNGDGFIWRPFWGSSYVGGQSEDIVTDLYKTSNRDLIAVGYTFSTDFPVLYAYDFSQNGGSDVFITSFGSNLRSTFLGGSENDFGYSIAGNGDKIFIAGQTNSSNFPVFNGYDSTYNNSIDGFYAKFDFGICCIGIRGNADYDSDDNINIADIIYLIDFLFKGGAEVVCFDEADISDDDVILVDDIVLLTNYLFKGGDEPPACP